MKATLFVGVCVLGLLWAVTRPQAHHAFAAEFEVSEVVTLKEATIVQMEWVNPHAWLTVDVTRDGKVERWSLEFGPPNLLFRKGYRKNSLLPDMQVSVVGFASKDGQKILNVDTVTLPDGRVLKGESNAATASPAPVQAPAESPASSR